MTVPPFRAIVEGAVDFDDDVLLAARCDRLLWHKPEVRVVTSCLTGVGIVAERWARSRGYLVHRFPYYPTQGFADASERHALMVAQADALILVWDGEDEPCDDLLSRARAAELVVRQVRL